MKNLLFWVVYYLISGLLLFSGTSKILEPQPMLDSIKVIINTNEELQIAVATLLPVIEIVLGIMLLLKKT
ncbi:MAG: MauE/DoxX family redox-associated membrane protein [Melioribacteraceae bacterium]